MVDDEIIVIRPGSFCSVTYYKLEKSPQLLAKRLQDHDVDLNASGVLPLQTRAEMLT